MNDHEVNKYSSEGKFVYVLNGQPLSLLRPQHTNEGHWDAQKERRLTSTITLSSQHDDRPLYKGPLLFVIDFYFPFPIKGPRALKKSLFHTVKPSLSNCIRYVSEVCMDVLYEDSCTITTIHAQKKFCTVPRTEFYIVELS